MVEIDYRKVFFDRYVTTHVQFAEEISFENSKIITKVLRKHFSRFLPVNKSSAILDVACGMGQLICFLQDMGYHNVYGIDIGAEQLEIAKKRGVKQVECIDLFEYLEKHENQFDVIFASHVIEHLKKEEALRALDLIYKSLKPCGQVMISTPNATSASGLYTTFGDFTHEIAFNPRSLSQLLRVCGFSSVNVVGQGPVAYDFRSSARWLLFNVLKIIYRINFMIQRGSGRSIWVTNPIFESTILAVAKK